VLRWFIYAVPPIVILTLLLFFWVLYEVAILYRDFFFNQSLSPWMLLVPGSMVPIGAILVTVAAIRRSVISNTRGPEVEIRYRALPSQKIRALGMVSASLKVKELVQRIRLMEGWDAPFAVHVQRLSGNFEPASLDGVSENELRRVVVDMPAASEHGYSQLSQYSREAVLRVDLEYNDTTERPIEEASGKPSHSLVLFLS
jgi:hypothetical protein